jgi:hypothetical protein
MRRLRIDRLDLHLKRVPAATARDAARLLGAALAKAFASAAPVSGDAAESNVSAPAAGRTARDAGHLAIGAAADAGTIAAGIAERVAAQARRRG